MGGSGGGQSSTTSQRSGPPKWELPYAKQETGVAQQLYAPGSQYPQQSVAGFSPDQLAAMGLTENLTGQQQGYLGQAQAANAALAGGTPDINAALGSLTGIATGQNPALNAGTQALQNLATGQNPWMQQAMGAAGGLLNDPTIQAAQAANQATMSGQYLDPSKNTALQAYLNAGMDPIVRNYQQAVAPNILSNAIASGGLGSSGTEQAFANAQNQLAQQLGNYAAGVIEPAYQQERQLQQGAIQAAPGLLQPAETGIGQIGSLLGQQAGAAQGLPGMLQPQLGAAGEIPGMYNPQQAAIGQAPGLSQAQYGPAGQLLDIGQQQQQQQQNILNTIFGNQMMPYQMLTQAANLVSPLSGGGGQSFQVSSMPGGSMK